MLNSLAAAMFKDFVTPFLPQGTSERSISHILKLMVILLGIFCTAIVYAIEHLGGLLSLQVSLNAVTLGPTLGLFTLGMLIPSANKKVINRKINLIYLLINYRQLKGAFYGLISSVLLMSWIVFSAQYYQFMGVINHPTRPLRSNNTTFYSINARDAFS